MEKTQDVDAIWRKVKYWGKFQKVQMFLILLDSGPCAFAILSAVFTGYLPPFTCDETAPVNQTETFKMSDNDHCHYDVYEMDGNKSTFVETRNCRNFKYSYELSYAYEWGLVCDKANLAALAQSLVIAGQGIGALTTSHISDRFGRKTVHVISHFGILLSMLTMAFSQNIYMLLVLRLIAGTFQQGMVCSAKILGLEMFPKEVRSHVEAATFLSWSFGVMATALYGYAFRNIHWRYLQIGFAVFSFYAVFQWWLMEESARWLICNGRIEKAKNIFRLAARRNGVSPETVDGVFEQNLGYLGNSEINIDANKTEESALDQSMVTGNTQNEKTADSLVAKRYTKDGMVVEKYTVLDILKNPSLRTNTLILWYTWIVATMTYFGLTLVTNHLAGDRFLNFFLSGVIEVPSLLLEFYLFNKIGRKKTMILFYATAGVSLIVSTALMTIYSDRTDMYYVATGFSLIGKSSITGSFSTVFLYTPEIYPTNYRNSGLGIASSISRIGGILAPFASNLALIALWIPGAIFGSMSLLVVVLASRLPESAVHELPETIAECDKWKWAD